MDIQNRLQKKNLKSIAGYLLLNRLKMGENLDYRHKYRFPFIGEIAKSGGAVNGKINGACALPLQPRMPLRMGNQGGGQQGMLPALHNVLK